MATKFSEAKVWKTGYAVWTKAEATGGMAVLFGDATDCSRLLYWGILSKIEIDENTTRYWVKEIREIRGKHAPQELSLRTGMTIAPDFIRPYAICRTPAFLA